MTMVANATTTATEIIPHFVRRIFLFARLMLRIFLTHLSLVPVHGDKSYRNEVTAVRRYHDIHRGSYWRSGFYHGIHSHPTDRNGGNPGGRVHRHTTLNL